jgi:hypothetical protein
MATKIVKCPKCGLGATHHNLGGVQCCHCGHGCEKLFESSEAPATIPPGKIKTVPLAKEGNYPLFQSQVKSSQTELF